MKKSNIKGKKSSGDDFHERLQAQRDALKKLLNKLLKKDDENNQDASCSDQQ